MGGSTTLANSQMSNKEVVNLESVVKSDSSVEQRVYFVRELQRSRASIKGRLFEGSIGLRRSYSVLCSREDCWEGVSHWLI